MDKLFLLKPDFTDINSSLAKQKFFCPPCAFILGMLNYYPELKNKIELVFTEYDKPRKQVVEIIGSENQNCPVLILDPPIKNTNEIKIQKYKEIYFINDERDIALYLSTKYQTGLPH